MTAETLKPRVPESPQQLTRWFVPSLALLAAGTPLSIDFYLPSFPDIQTGLHTTDTLVQLTLTGFLAGLAIGQPLWGPLSDRFGRRSPLIIGATIGTLAAFACALAPTIGILIAARFVQALAAGAAVVMSRAIIADRLSGFPAARAMTLMMSITSCTPAIAPVFGSLLATHVSWRAVLLTVAVLFVLQVAVIIFLVPESLPPERRRPALDFADLWRVARRPAYLGYATVQFFAMCTTMTYVASSSFLVQGWVGVGALPYAADFALNAMGMVGASILSSRLAHRRVHPALTASKAMPVACLGAILVLLIAVTGAPRALILIPLFFTQTTNGFIFGNVTALATEQSRPMIGAGSALIGSASFIAGAAVSPIGGVAAHTAVPIGVLMTCCSLLCITIFTAVRRHIAARPHLEAVFES